MNHKESIDLQACIQRGEHMTGVHDDGTCAECGLSGYQDRTEVPTAENNEAVRSLLVRRNELAKREVDVLADLRAAERRLTLIRKDHGQIMEALELLGADPLAEFNDD